MGGSHDAVNISITFPFMASVKAPFPIQAKDDSLGNRRGFEERVEDASGADYILHHDTALDV